MDALAQAMRDLDEKKVNELVEEKIKAGVPAMEIVKICNEGMVAIGDLFSQGVYFISELLFSAEILKGVMKRLDPLLQAAGEGSSAGKVVIGTVKGDIHDIGKNIVITLMRGAGFEVIDLGVDVPAQKFVEAVRAERHPGPGLKRPFEPDLSRDEVRRRRDHQGGPAGPGQDHRRRGARSTSRFGSSPAPIIWAPDAVAGVNLCRQIYG